MNYRLWAMTFSLSTIDFPLKIATHLPWTVDCPLLSVSIKFLLPVRQQRPLILQQNHLHLHDSVQRFNDFFILHAMEDLFR